MNRWLTGVVLVLYLCLLTTPAQAVVVWNEAVDGDISTDRNNPSSAALARGSNTLTATSVGPPTSNPADREYITFSLPTNGRLSALYVQAYAGLDGTAFIGVQSGTTFTEPPTGTDPANLLGYSHFGPAVQPVGSNILSDMGQGFGSQGFTPPLTGSNYTFWIQQTGANSATYTLDFFVSPEPAAIAMFGIGGVIVLLAKRRCAR
jgi:hypothetical protein